MSKLKKYLKKYLKSIAGGEKGYEKLAKSIAKECGNINLLANAGLSGVAGGVRVGMPEVYKKKIVKKNGNGSANPDLHSNINNQIYASMPISDPQQWWNGWVPNNGNVQPEVGYRFDGDIYGSLADAALSGVAGGSGEEDKVVIDEIGSPYTNPSSRYGRLVYGARPRSNPRRGFRQQQPLPTVEDIIRGRNGGQ